MTTAENKTKIRSLDRELPMLAAMAAMELDNFMTGGSREFENLHELSLRFANSFPGDLISSSANVSHLEGNTVRVVGESFVSSGWVSNLSSIEQLSAPIKTIASEFIAFEGGIDQDRITKMRDFCSDLAKRCLMSIETVSMTYSECNSER